jgi:hypothetical protein
MYKSPIELLVTDIQNQILKQQDEEVYQAVLHYIPDVDKVELVRALQYDREQYEKGYADGKRDAVEVVHAHWEDGCAIHNGKEVYKSIDCSHCNEIFKTEEREYWKKRFKVCPFCGAIMDGVDDDV